MKRKFKKICERQMISNLNVNSLRYSINDYSQSYNYFSKVMIQIRQKKQVLRNQRRKEFIQNHFKNLRKRYFDLQPSSQQHNFHNEKILRELLAKSLTPQSLNFQIQEGKLFQEIIFFVDSAINKNDKLSAKYVLVIVSNLFKDQMSIYDKQNLFRISIKLFQSFHISKMDLKIMEQRKLLSHISQTLSLQVLSYYISNSIMVSQNLDEEDRQLVERIIYPAFMNVLFYALKNNNLIGSVENFCDDVEQSILNIFDLKEQVYETGNRQKVKRNQDFFNNLVVNHYMYLCEFDFFPDKLQRIETRLFWLYDKLTDYEQQIEHFFRKSQLWMIIQQSFRSELSGNNPKNIIHLYSLMRSLIDRNIFLNQINCLMEERINLGQTHIIEKVFKSIESGSRQSFQSLQFLQGIIISYYENKYFARIIQIFGLQLMQSCVNVLFKMERASLGIQKQTQAINKVLIIVSILIQKEEENANHRVNKFAVFFERNQGMRKIEEISLWLEQTDYFENSTLEEIKDLVTYISVNGYELEIQQQNLI